MSRHTTALSRVLVTLSTVVVALVLLLPAAGRADGEGGATTVHSVVLGDTLWEIAADATPMGGDVRSTIAKIRGLNGLTTSLIVPGQELVVPAASGA